MNEEDVRFTYKFLGHERETELRLIDPRAQLPPRSVFVHSEDEFVRVCAEQEGKYNVYAGINERRAGGTKREDVLRVGAIPIDADPVRPDPRQASTDEEMALAVSCARALQKRSRSHGLESCLAESGNGAQLWIKADIREQLDRAEAGIQQYERDLAARAPSGVRIDNIGDLPRIIKVIGTLSIKGDGKPPRPHRLSRWLDAKIVPPVNREFMDTLLAAVPAPATTPTSLAAAPLTAEQIRRVVEGLGSKAVLLFDGRYSELVNLRGEPYKSRNEAESALASVCSSRGLAQNVTVAILGGAKIGKWNERSDSYRRSILKSAYAQRATPVEPTPRAGDANPWADRLGWEDEPALPVVLKEIETDDGRKLKVPKEPAIVEFNRLVGDLGYRPFRTLDGQARVAVPGTYGLEVHDPKGEKFVDFLGYVGYTLRGEPVPRSALFRTSTMFDQRALARSLPEERVVDLRIRIAPIEGGSLLDLHDAKSRCVRVTADGWSLETIGYPVFESPANLLPLPDPELSSPVPRGGDPLADLWRFVTPVSGGAGKRARLLLTTLLVQPLVDPDLPRPVLIVRGPEGSGKSQQAATVQAATDPSVTETLDAPKTEDAFADAVRVRNTLNLDNVSFIPTWLSDALCRASGGGGLAKRALYTDKGEVLSRAVRSVIVNGITAEPRRPDLLRRSLFFDLDPGLKKVDPQRLRREWRVVHPRILSRLLDLAVAVLRIRRDDPPPMSNDPMAGFVEVGRAVAMLSGLAPSEFDAAWGEMVDEQGALAAENPWAVALSDAFGSVPERALFTAAEIARRIGDRHPESFPHGVKPEEVGHAISRNAKVLRERFGVEVTKKTTRVGKNYSWVKVPEITVTTVTAVQETLPIPSETDPLKQGDGSCDGLVTVPEDRHTSGDGVTVVTVNSKSLPPAFPSDLAARIQWLRRMGFSDEADALEAHPEDYKVPARGTVTPPPDGGEP